MILASGARGPEFDSRNTPFSVFFLPFIAMSFISSKLLNKALDITRAQAGLKHKEQYKGLA
jgi:hypothetical protein